MVLSVLTTVFWLFTALRLENGLLSRESRLHLYAQKSKAADQHLLYSNTPGSEGSPAFFDFVLPPPRQQVAHHATHQLLRELEWGLGLGLG